jgi:DNA polymerase-1
VLVVDGFEADDIIGTLVKRAELEEFESFMVTPDKDFAQLISKSTCMWKPGRKGSDHEVIDLPTMLKNWEIEHPAQVIDILGLWGDAADNIPGIPGIGEKTAKKLIAEFGSIENLIANSAKLKGKQKENVESHANQALLSKELATIILDVPVDVTWEDLIISERDEEALKTLFTEFEFRTLTKRLFPDVAAVSKNQASDEVTVPTLFETFKTIRDVEHTYHLADTPELQSKLPTGILLLRHRDHRPRPLHVEAARRRFLLESPRRLVPTDQRSQISNLRSQIHPRLTGGKDRPQPQV